jgi:hypothetical protein
VVLLGSEQGNACLRQLTFREAHIELRDIPGPEASLGDVEESLLELKQPLGGGLALTGYERSMKGSVYIAVHLPAGFIEFGIEAFSRPLGRFQSEATLAGDLEALRQRTLKVHIRPIAAEPWPGAYGHLQIFGQNWRSTFDGCLAERKSLPRYAQPWCVMVGICQYLVERDRTAACRIRQWRVWNMHRFEVVAGEGRSRYRVRW